MIDEDTVKRKTLVFKLHPVSPPGIIISLDKNNSACLSFMPLFGLKQNEPLSFIPLSLLPLSDFKQNEPFFFMPLSLLPNFRF
jgi:hypothetical protein